MTFGCILLEYEIETGRILNECYDHAFFESDDDKKENINKKAGTGILESIKKLFLKVKDWIRDKIAGHALKKNLRTVEEMLNNSKTLANKKITVPYYSMNANVKEAIRNGDTKAFYDESKKKTTTIGEAFNYLKNNINNYDRSMDSILSSISQAMNDNGDKKEVSGAAEIAANYTKAQRFSIFGLLKNLVNMVLAIPKGIGGMVLKVFHIDKNSTDIKILREGRKIRSISINGRKVDILYIKNNKESQERFGMNTGFIAQYNAGAGYDCISLDPNFDKLPDYQQNAIIYHELGHATLHKIGDKHYSKHHNTKEVLKSQAYIGDLKKCYEEAKKRVGGGYDSHLSIKEVQADFFSCQKGQYQGRRDILLGYMKDKSNPGLVKEAKIRLMTLDMMKKKGYF